MDSNIFSSNLRKLRTGKNYTQEKVAEILGVSAQSVSRWECGNTLPDVLLLPEIGKLYGVTVDDLFKEDILGYKNYAQRLLAEYEQTGDARDFIRAQEEFEKLIKSGKSTMDDLRAYGILYQYMMNNCKDKALECFKQVLSNGKDIDGVNYYRTYEQKILLMSNIGLLKTEIDELETSLDEDDNNPRQWILLISAYYLDKQYKVAYDYVINAIKRFPDEALIYAHAGDICRQLEKYEEAFTYWNKSLELDNTFLDSKYAMGFCYEALGQYDKAYGIWKELAAILEKRGLKKDMEFPLKLADKCKEKKMD